MPYLTFSLQVTSDVGGSPQLTFQKIIRLFVTEAQNIAMQKAGGDTVGVFTTVPTIDKSPVLNALALATDAPVLIKLNSVVNSDGIISLKANGFVLVVNANIASGATTDATINNTPATVANLSGLAGGT